MAWHCPYKSVFLKIPKRHFLSFFFLATLIGPSFGHTDRLFISTFAHVNMTTHHAWGHGIWPLDSAIPFPSWLAGRRGGDAILILDRWLVTEQKKTSAPVYMWICCTAIFVMIVSDFLFCKPLYKSHKLYNLAHLLMSYSWSRVRSV